MIYRKATILTRCRSIGQLGAGAVTNVERDGWRNIFWMQAAFHLATVIMLLAFYFPPRRSDYPRTTFAKFVWSLDPIGSVLFISSTALILLALDWTGGSYPWHNVHIGAPLGIGLGLLLFFGLYGKPLRKIVPSNRAQWEAQNGKEDPTVLSLMYATSFHALFKTLTDAGVVRKRS